MNENDGNFIKNILIFRINNDEDDNIFGNY